MMAVPSILSTPKDCVVKYQLYPKLDKPTDPKKCLRLCEGLVIEYIAKLSPFLEKYIWQNDSFNLRVGSSSENAAVLEGSTNYGDNIEDEWFIVFLLNFLTKEDSHLIIKVEDSDGEFLLIEAADSLPKWVNPETSENRVYLYQGSVHLLPLALSPGEVTPSPSGTPSIFQALQSVRSHSKVTRAPEGMQDAIRERIKELRVVITQSYPYPEKISQLHHRSHCFVPSSLASLLANRPTLVAPAISAFYHRDPIDLKACRAMKYFPPETRVMTEVTFTRCLYAQLVQQKFEPDRRTGWNLPNPRSPTYPAHCLGMKLACGFEILASQSSEHVPGNKAAIGPADLESDPHWNVFLKSLAQKGFFRDELEGSKLYQELVQKAEQFYSQSMQRTATDAASSVGSQILSLLKTIDTDYEQLKQAEKNLRPPDDDSWLDLTPDLLDSILEEYSMRTTSGNSQLDGAQETMMAEKITGTLREFMEGSSGLEGVTPSPRKRHPRKKNLQQANNNNNNNNNVDFDADGFTDAVKSILYFKVPESDSSSSSSMSGYSDEEEEPEVEEESKMVDQQRPERPPRRKDKVRTVSCAVEEMKQYLEQMDRELAATQVGQSFERTDAPSAANIHNDDQLNDSIEEESDDFRPVDIDLTALKNILESYNSQGGLPGPASTLLQSIGLSLPDNADND